MQPLVTFCTAICLLYAIFRLFQAPDKSEKDTLPPRRIKHWLLFTVSAATLFIELVIIRWVGTEVRIFAFVQNVVLVACFLGFGVGCFTSAKPGPLLPSLYTLTLLAVVICLPSLAWQDALLHLSNVLTLSSDAALWGYAGIPFPLPPALLAVMAMTVVAGFLWLIAMTMVPLGRWVGYCFDHSKNIVSAYTVNLAGSLVGTWLLVILAWLELPPAAWLALAFALVISATYKSRPARETGLLLLLPLAIMVHGGIKQGAIWSPYQKLAVDPRPHGEYLVTVNNVGYMTMANTQPEFLKGDTKVANAYKDSVYDTPFLFIPKGGRVLIVGAGAGNDASAALRNGAAQVDAVEIDPEIYALGRKLHPDRPYDSEKVNVIINDARNFFRRSPPAVYDAVIFGLLDSHTEVSGYTNMRVDNYVYTMESFEQARRLLKKDGVMAVKFEVREPWTWMGSRFFRTITEVFGKAPVAYHAVGGGNMWGGTVFLNSDGETLAKRAETPEMKKFLAAHKVPYDLSPALSPRIATDDWPYPYNYTNMIPQTYLAVSLVLLGLAWLMVRRVVVWSEKQTWKMFALGAGFMLMETQMISRLTLYFGTTWIVNSIAISVILTILMLANLHVMRTRKIDRPVYWIALLVSLGVNYVFPWEALPYAPWVVGLLLSAAYAVAVFMAGVLFVSTFKKAQKKSAALGANVIGSVVGGISQNLSFIFGLKALLPLAALFYGAYAWLATRK
ncbi:MAG TPA: hypothetical protein VEF76_08085 [Patescibacteria group bacterium]|nr:hypothetical protein [Patescibacteria group bacterium]